MSAKLKSSAGDDRLKIVHMCLANYFADNQLYQENQLVRRHVDAGHEVVVIASTETFDVAGQITYAMPGDYIGAEGARVVRLPYRRYLPKAAMRKLRLHPGVRRLLEDIAPDVIMFHGIAGFEMLTVERYVRKQPHVVFHIDSHADAVNSARSWVSKVLLHGQYYRRILRRAMRQSGSLLCVSLSAVEFAAQVYGVSRDRLEFFPLGGQVPGRDDYSLKRNRVRKRLGLNDQDIMIVQAGKQGRAKRLPEALRAFASVPDKRFRLFIAGVLQPDIEDECRGMIACDPRVSFLGWQGSDALDELLCGADLYLQPGTQSVTMQHSLCCSCAVILHNEPAHAPYHRNNGWLIQTEQDIARALTEVRSADLAAMGSHSRRLAKSMLDYRSLAERVLRP